MPISDRSFERLDRGIRTGLSLWAESEREERKRKEREEIRAEERKYKKRQETRQQERFDWAKEDYQKKKNYDVMKSEFDLGTALIESGNIREGAARYVNAFNKKWPDRRKAILAFRSDKPDAPSLAEWDSKPGLAGKEIAIFLEEEGKGKGLLTFKSIENFKRFVKMTMTPENYLKASKESEAAVAKKNAQEIPFRTREGTFINTWIMGPDGNPVRGPARPYKGKMPMTKAQQLGLDIKEHEKIIGEELTPAQKRKKLGYEIKKSATLDEYKKKLDLLMRPFHKKESLYDEFGDLIEESKSAFDVAWDLIAKARKDPKSLTAKERENLNYARRARKVFDDMSEFISPGIEPEEEKPTWQQYRTRPTSPGGRTRSRTKLPPGEEQKFQEWYSFWANKTRINPDPDDPRQKYDYRAAYQQGMEPEIDPRDGEYHWPSVHKDLDHPNRFVNGVDTISSAPYQQPRLGIRPAVPLQR